MNLGSLHWISKCLILAFGFAAFPLITASLAQKGTRGDVTMAAWCLGTAIGMYSCAKLGGLGLISGDASNYTKPLLGVLIAFFLGATLGTILNTFYGQAVTSAPNPALALTVINASAAIAYLSGPLFHKIIPKAFPPAVINWNGLAGVTLVITGIVLISRK